MRQTLFDKITANRLFSDKLPLETRIANLACISGIFGALVAILIKAAQGIPSGAIVFLLVSLAASTGLYAALTRTGHNKAGIIVLLVGVTDILIPYTFFYGGGFSSALPIYLVLAVVLQSLLFRGTDFLIMAGINLTIIVCCILYAGFHPEAIVFVIEDRRLLVVDILQGLLICSLFISGIFRFQLWTYNNERVKAEEASRVKGQFLANMSHEIRTPLSAIIGMTTIAEQTDDPARKDYSLMQIKNASHHLMGVVNDILDMSKIEEDKLEFDNIPFCFPEIIKRTADLFGFRAGEKRQTITIDLAPEIPGRLLGDDQRLAQVVGNLLSNAIKFTPEGGRIGIRAAWGGEEGGLCAIEVSISDNGIGITPEQQERLFVAFQQAESGTSRQYGGTGLGLTISKRIVEMMGGRIWVESEYGKGSTFSFVVKLARAPEGGGAADAAAGAGAGAAGAAVDAASYDFSAYRLLIAEDVEINREILITLLEPTGIRMDCAENGAEAVEMLAAAPRKYDIIFMDIQMPVMDGYEATRRIRALDDEKARSIPIVAVSANIFKEDIEKSLAAGMNAHTGKPIDIGEAIGYIMEFLEPQPS
ncbi:MAG: response regulator [Clostridiales Family XIII bacterium]|jgi:signal transduction histidine kinase/CheY-like chemotaxis protein|nr:response regulator [Clostridiales Family XIII bacterium]